MAYNDFVQNIINTDTDAISFQRFMQGLANEIVKRRIAGDTKTLNYYLDFLHGLELVYSQASGEVDVNGVKVKTVTQAIKDAIAAAGVANGVNANLVVYNNRTQSSKNLDTVNVLDYMTDSELSAYQADATTFNAAPIFNRASVDCYNKKRKLMAYGTFYTTETIVITSDCDLSQADILTTASLAIDVRNVVDTASIKRLISNNIMLPRTVKYTPKTSTGWDTNTVGIKLTNLYSCKVWFGRTTGFETNNHIYSDGTGNVHNEYFMGWCENGKVNLLLSANDTGWTNENNFYGGRFSHESAEGTNVAGTRHIKIAATELVINNNVFYKPSVEAGIAEYHVECGGSINSFLYARWEASPAKVLYVCNDASKVASNQGQKNLISGGYNTDAIVISKSGTKSSFGNRLIGQSRELNSISGTVGGHRYRNKSSSSEAVLTVFGADTDIDVADLSSYAVSLSSMQLQGKRATDAFPQINIDFANGKFLLGNGTVAPSWGIEKLGTYAAWVGGEFMPKSTDTQNLGKTNYKWKQLYLSDGFGAWGATPPTSKPSVTGSRGGNAALASLITVLASYGLITDSTTA